MLYRLRNGFWSTSFSEVTVAQSLTGNKSSDGDAGEPVTCDFVIREESDWGHHWAASSLVGRRRWNSVQGMVGCFDL
jgi:hypothetical protein